MSATPNERALLNELLKLRECYETGSQSLQEMFERTSRENEKVTRRLIDLDSQVQALAKALESLSARL